jgi:hypothetical protein
VKVGNVVPREKTLYSQRSLGGIGLGHNFHITERITGDVENKICRSSKESKDF